MTEEEARNKMCPKMIARMYLDHRSGATEYDYSYCIASDCMHWPECLSWWIEYEKGNEPIKVEIVGGKL